MYDLQSFEQEAKKIEIDTFLSVLLVIQTNIYLY